MSQAVGQRSESRFFVAMSIAAVALLFVGFAPSFYLKPLINAPTPPLTLLTVAHGVVFTAWMALFVTQAFLIHTARPAVHRREDGLVDTAAEDGCAELCSDCDDSVMVM